MKKTLAAIFLLLGTITISFGQDYDSFGKKISAKKANDISWLENKTEFGDKTVKIEGEVESVCQNMGCWVKLKKSDGSTMTVRFKDYGFFVPKDIAGKKIIIQGIPEIKTTSVDELKHFAEDAGKSQAEIDAITDGKTELTFTADGVLVPKK